MRAAKKSSSVMSLEARAGAGAGAEAAAEAKAENCTAAGEADDSGGTVAVVGLGVGPPKRSKSELGMAGWLGAAGWRAGGAVECGSAARS